MHSSAPTNVRKILELKTTQNQNSLCVNAQAVRVHSSLNNRGSVLQCPRRRGGLGPWDREQDWDLYTSWGPWKAAPSEKGKNRKKISGAGGKHGQLAPGPLLQVESKSTFLEKLTTNRPALTWVCNSSLHCPKVQEPQCHEINMNVALGWESLRGTKTTLLGSVSGKTE